MKKIAVIMMNLGGPDKLDNVEKFLYNLFSDKAIIDFPNPFRWLIAKIISKKRANTAKEIYQHIGGKSPILDETIKQKKALEERLSKSENEFKIFITMRYFNPYSNEVINQIMLESFDEIILLPLYPQYSISTTKSSIENFVDNLKKKSVNIPVKSICCYPEEDNFIKSHIDLITEYYNKAKEFGDVKILFSAHGLPEKMIRSGDPYQYQIELTVNNIVKKICIENLDYIISYQSRVGPMKWLKPFTDEEIKASRGKVLVIVPIAFVSEHSETLVELDIEYFQLAKDNGVKQYFRVPALSINKFYIECLAGMCEKISNVATEERFLNLSNQLNRICPKEFCQCINNYE